MNQDDTHNIPAVGVAIEADRETTTMRITGFDLSIGTNEPKEPDDRKDEDNEDEEKESN